MLIEDHRVGGRSPLRTVRCPLRSSSAALARGVVQRQPGQTPRTRVLHPFDPRHEAVLLDVERAIAANRRLRGTLSWGREPRLRQDLALAVGYTGPITEKAFAVIVAQWQMVNDLDVDGILGPDTWRRVQRSGRYAKGERSASELGHLADPIFEAGRGSEASLHIADFPVNSAVLPAAVAGDARFLAFVEEAEDNELRTLTVTGYSDSIGGTTASGKARNASLRLQRARAILAALGPQARQRATAEAAPRGQYVVDNLSPAGRAMNRAVLVRRGLRAEFSDTDASTVVPEGDIIDLALAALDRHEPKSPMRCVIEGLRKPGFSDVVIDGFRSMTSGHLSPQDMYDERVVLHVRDELVQEIDDPTDRSAAGLRQAYDAVKSLENKHAASIAWAFKFYMQGSHLHMSRGDKFIYFRMKDLQAQHSVIRCLKDVELGDLPYR